ncbi:hypothetical protein CK203_028623 [Vitis vinifera]|uniref:Uncharacterized protein n=1 Tax=Vitis vinifera TaxID=29760 RepID=A0A438I2D1_VITVI|nr:hypothetical protein CK203_028623 [Vitis vinifera]
MQERNNKDLYNPIDLNHIFNDDDILDEWIREGDEPILSSDNLDWLDKGLPPNEEGRKTIHEDDGATNRRGGGTSGGSRGVGGIGEEEYSNIETRASDSYGYDQSSSSSSIAYRGFGYYQYGVDLEQPSKPYFSDYGSSSQSS